MIETMRIAPRPSGSEGDLAGLASLAAIALDEFTLGRGANLDAVKELADEVAAKFPNQAFDPTAAIAVRRAFVETPGFRKVTTVGELREETMGLLARLSRFAADPHSTGEEEAARLRTFCVALSRMAIGLGSAVRDRSSRSSRFY